MRYEKQHRWKTSQALSAKQREHPFLKSRNANFQGNLNPFILASAKIAFCGQALTIVTISDHIHRLLRKRRMCIRYREMVKKVGPSIDDRVRFHVEHLDEYWQRCVGFLELFEKEKKPVTSSFLRNDLFVCVRVASQAATIDVEKLCLERPATRLKDVWQQYLEELIVTKKAPHETASAMMACAQSFGKFRDEYRAASLEGSRKK